MAALDENGKIRALRAPGVVRRAPRCTRREDIDRIVEEAIPCFDPLMDYFDQVNWAG